MHFRRGKEGDHPCIFTTYADTQRARQTHNKHTHTAIYLKGSSVKEWFSVPGSKRQTHPSQCQGYTDPTLHAAPVMLKVADLQ